MIASISTNRWFGLFLLITAAFYVCDMWIFSAFAENRWTPMTIYNAMGFPVQCSYSKYVIPHVIECIKEATINTTYTMTHSIESHMRYPMMAFLTLTVVHFGYLMLTQEKQLQQKGVILLLKVGFVFWMTNDFGGMIPAVYAVMDEGQAIVSDALLAPALISAVAANLGVPTIGCPDLSLFMTGGDLWIWGQASCILGQLMGYGPGVLLASSLFGLLGSFIGGGALGVTIFFEGIIALVSIFMLILRAMFFYVTAYLMVGFLITLAPILLPCIFMKETFNYFNKWVGAIMGMMINPMIITAYMVIALMVVDAVLFRGDDSLVGVLQSPELETCLKTSDPEGDNIAANPYLQFGGDSSALQKEGQLNPMVGMLSGVTNPMASLFGNQRDYIIDCDDDPYTDTDEHFEILGNIMMGILRVLLVVWLLVQVMELVPTIAAQISGSGYRLNSAVEANFETTVKGGTDKAINEARRDMSAAASGGPGPGGVESYIGSFDDGLNGLASSLTGQRNR